jgi:hypothetical protein
MANESTAMPAVPLFQKAHARMVTLHRVDEQLATLLDQRTRLQGELREIQSQINSEFTRVTAMDEEAPAKVLATIAEIARGNRAPEAPAALPPTESSEEPMRAARSRRAMANADKEPVSESVAE